MCFIGVWKLKTTLPSVIGKRSEMMEKKVGKLEKTEDIPSAGERDRIKVPTK
jgi:hypothetical protein